MYQINVTFWGMITGLLTGAFMLGNIWFKLDNIDHRMEKLEVEMHSMVNELHTINVNHEHRLTILEKK